MENKIDSAVVISTYFGNRCKYPMDINATLYVLYDSLNHYISFDFGLPCNIIIVNHDVTRLKDFDKIISEDTKKLICKGQELLNEFKGIKLFNGGEIKIVDRPWNDGSGMAMSSFNYAFEKFKEEYNYWLFNEDDVKIKKSRFFKELIDILNSDDKIAFVSLWKTISLGVSNTFYMSKMYEQCGRLKGTYKELTMASQIKSIERQPYFDWFSEMNEHSELGSKRKEEGDDGQNGWKPFFESNGYKIVGFHPTSCEPHNEMYNRVNHTINKDQTPRIEINEKNESVLIYSDGRKEIINKWIK